MFTRRAFAIDLSDPVVPVSLGALPIESGSDDTI